jgi:hypothetical protein
MRILNLLSSVLAGHFVVGLAVTPAIAGDLRILAVSSVGESRRECHVDRFVPVETNSLEQRNYNTSFAGLVGSNLPNGRFDVTIMCSEGALHATVVIDRARQLAVASQIDRHMLGERGNVAITIRMDPPSTDMSNWWVQMIGLYNRLTYTGQFSPDAVMYDPEPGSYVVLVRSTSGYECLREVDFVEHTRSWAFHPATCSFEFDPFAHLVTDEDRKTRKRSPWYIEMRKRNEEFFKTLERSADK